MIGFSKLLSGVLSKFEKNSDKKYPSVELLNELEEAMIASDIDLQIAAEIIKKLSKEKFESESGIKEFLAEQIAKILTVCEKKLQPNFSKTPQVIIINGVNGVGKTTTIGKLAKKFPEKKVLIAACDTFRAAAFEQLAIWAKRVGCEIIAAKREGEDPASIAYQALDYAKKNSFDLILIDTAGRLQNKTNLMDELRKINSVLKKLDPSAPHENILVLDAAIGKNSQDQFEIFNQVCGVTGLIITKLDGSARGGNIVSIAKKFQKPIYGIGVGEGVGDLREFDAKEFARKIVGF